MAGVNMSILEDRDNIFSLLRDLENHCLSATGERDRAFHILMKVWDKVGASLFNLGYWHDFFRCGNIALRVATHLNDVPGQGMTLGEIGWVLMEWGEFESAQKYFNEALEKYKLFEDAKGMCRSLRYLGVLSHRQDNISSALDCYRQALDIAAAERTKASPEDQNVWAMSEAELHNMLGVYYIQLCDFPASYCELSFSLELYRSISDPYYRYYHAAPLINFGNWHFLQQDYKNAKRYYKECLALSEEIRRTDMVAQAMLRLAEVAEAEGNQEEALQLATEAERVAGTEITSVREEAARFKERIQANPIRIGGNIEVGN